MSGVLGALDYAGYFSEAAGNVDGVNGWEAVLCDGLGYIHDVEMPALDWGKHSKSFNNTRLKSNRFIWEQKPMVFAPK